MKIYRNVKITKSVGKSKSSKGIRCYECQGYGHTSSDCANRKSKKMTFYLTWNDKEKKSESTKPDISKEKFIAFMVTSSSTTPHVSSDYEIDHNDNESEEELDWKTKYETLFKKTIKMVKVNEKVAIK